MHLLEVEHQPAAHQRLQRALTFGRAAHAYLFAGPEGVGKQMLATRCARVLLCPNPVPISAPSPGDVSDGGPAGEWRDACGRCTDCALMEAGSHPDFHLVYRALNRFHPDPDVQKRKAVALGIGVIRHFLIDPIGRRPARGRCKVFVVCDAHRLSDDAENALLKTLEEPPPGSYIILLAHSRDQVFPTILSRCQIVPFRALPPAYVRRLLTDRGLPDVEAEYLAALSGGQPGFALWASQIGVLALRRKVESCVLQALLEPMIASTQIRDLVRSLGKTVAGHESHATSEADATRTACRLVLAMIAHCLRAGLRTACGIGRDDGPDSPDEHAARCAERLGPRGLARALHALGRAEAGLELNVNHALMFDGLTIALHRSAENPSAAFV